MDGLRPDLVRGEVAELRHRLNQISTKDLRSRLAAVEGRLDAGYVYGGQVVYTSSGTFKKADYPGLRAVKAHCQGGGGGSGGAGTTGASESAEGGGGGGGGYACSTLLVSELGASETVTVGAGGVRGSPGSSTNGGNSSFGSHVVGEGGGAGSAGTATSGNTQNSGGLGGGGTGDLVIPGDAGMYGIVRGGIAGFLNYGGGSHLGGVNRTAHSHSTDGADGAGYGGGGSGGRNGASQSAKFGGHGAPGVVIVELWF